MESSEIVKRIPVNKTAAIVVSKGVEYVAPKKVLTGDSDVPMPTRRPPKDALDLSGVRRCRLVVIGLSSDVAGKWVCRCDCGTYVYRSAKAIKNERNNDRCEQCRHLAHLRRTDEFRRTGKNRIVKSEDDL